MRDRGDEGRERKKKTSDGEAGAGEQVLAVRVRGASQTGNALVGGSALLENSVMAARIRVSRIGNKGNLETIGEVIGHDIKRGNRGRKRKGNEYTGKRKGVDDRRSKSVMNIMYKYIDSY